MSRNTEDEAAKAERQRAAEEANQLRNEARQRGKLAKMSENKRKEEEAKQKKAIADLKEHQVTKLDQPLPFIITALEVAHKGACCARCVVPLIRRSLCAGRKPLAVYMRSDEFQDGLARAEYADLKASLEATIHGARIGLGVTLQTTLRSVQARISRHGACLHCAASSCGGYRSASRRSTCLAIAYTICSSRSTGVLTCSAVVAYC